MAVLKKFKDLQVHDTVFLLTPTTLNIKSIMVDGVAPHKDPRFISLNLRLDLSHKHPEITTDLMDIARKEGVDVGKKVIVNANEQMVILAQNVPTILSTDKKLLEDWMKHTG